MCIIDSYYVLIGLLDVYIRYDGGYQRAAGYSFWLGYGVHHMPSDKLAFRQNGFALDLDAGSQSRDGV